MATRAENVARLDAFMAKPKRIVGFETQNEWLEGHTAGERRLVWPLEVDGEQLPRHSLHVIGFPRQGDDSFRLIITAPATICRLDFTDEIHTNSYNLPEDGLPGLVRGPHYHSWSLNRRFFMEHDDPVRLSNAAPWDGGGQSFDAILRAFCDDNNIEPLPSLHHVELPRQDGLL